MNLLALNCPNCGAPLEVRDRTRQIACRYCSSLLLIVQRPDAPASASILRKGLPLNAAITSDPRSGELQEDLRRLDRDWTCERAKLLAELNPARFHVVDREDAVIIASVLGLGFAACAIAAWVVGVSGLVFVALGGVLPVAWYVTCGGLNVRDSAAYVRQRDSYATKRTELVSELRGRLRLHGIDSEEVDLLPTGAEPAREYGR